MNILNLIRGQKIKITDLTKDKFLQVGIFCKMPVGIKLDIACFCVDAQNQLSDDRYFIFSSQKISPCKSIEILESKNGDHELFQVDLSNLPKSIRKLVFVAAINGDSLMSQIENGYFRLLDQSNEITRFSFSGNDFGNEKAIIIGEIYFKDVWRLAAVGQGFNGGLTTLLKYFGKDADKFTLANAVGIDSSAMVSSIPESQRPNETKANTPSPSKRSETMHKKNIEVLRSEAQRLIELQLVILRKMLAEPGVITESQVDQKQTFDKDTTPQFIEVLEGEKKKLDRLEMVLAVVGTMKAGKSTSINAIVGTEVLPNRNRPMTALPTLIEHTKGQLEPILEFKNRAPIEKLLRTLEQVIQQNGKSLISKFSHDQDLLNSFELIPKPIRFQQNYNGAEAIFEFLKTLNDLVRLSMELDVEFPFSSYAQIHELPVIKIEFVHLGEMQDTTGKLTLLDTPG